MLTAKTLKTLVQRHEAAGAAATVVTAVLDDPYGYGRIVRSGEQIARIVEERDTIVHPCVFIEGRTKIGSNCEIHSGVRLVDAEIGDRVVVHNHCVITNAKIADDAAVGPFAHLRNETDVGEKARIG